MSNEGMELKQMALALQNLVVQILEMAKQISTINLYAYNQFQNIGTQISNYANQIFMIGMKLSDNKNVYDFENAMPRPFNNFNNFNINLGYGKKINIVFERIGEIILTVYISEERTIEELLNIFLEKKGLDSNYFINNTFYFNAKKLDPNSKVKIKEAKIMDRAKILIIEGKDVLGK